MTTLEDRLNLVERKLEEQKQFLQKSGFKSKIVSSRIVTEFLKQHPEIKTASEAVEILLNRGIGSEQDLLKYKSFNFGTNTSKGREPLDKSEGSDIQDENNQDKSVGARR